MNLNNVLYGEGWNPQPLGCESPAFTTRPRLQSIFIYFNLKPNCQLRKQLKKYQRKTFCLHFSRLHPAYERLYHGGLRRDRPEGPSPVHQQHADQGRGGGRKNGDARVQSSEPRRQNGERDDFSSFSFKSKNWFFVGSKMTSPHPPKKIIFPKFLKLSKAYEDNLKAKSSF